MNDFSAGARDGLPITLGYFAVSFSLGILAVKLGIGIFPVTLMSLTNVTSAGEFAGISIIAASGTIAEMIVTQFIINLRYALMSLALTQKLPEDTKLWKKFVIAFANTDEIFAVAMGTLRPLTLKYMLGLQIFPILGWTMGTLIGAAAGSILPAIICTALSVALYSMFIAIVIPVAKKSKPVTIVVIISLGLSCLLYYVPGLNRVSSGIAIIICTVAASAIGAVLFPVKDEEKEKSNEEIIREVSR